MNYSAKLTNSSDKCYYDAICNLDNRFYPIIDDCELFVLNFGTHIEEIKFPCDRLVLIPWIGKNNAFAFNLFLKDERVGAVTITIERYGVIKAQCDVYAMKSKELNAQFESLIEDYFEALNKTRFKWLLSNSGLKKDEEGNYSIDVVWNEDYKPTDKEKTLKGSIADIFFEYPSINETYKYCNGMCYTFKDEKIKELYRFYTSMGKGNYFLYCAVKNGSIID